MHPRTWRSGEVHVDPPAVLAGCARDVRPTAATRTSSFFNDTAPTEIYTLSLHDALPICLISDPAAESAGVLILIGRRTVLVGVRIACHIDAPSRLVDGILGDDLVVLGAVVLVEVADLRQRLRAGLSGLADAVVLECADREVVVGVGEHLVLLVVRAGMIGSVGDPGGGF